MKILLVNVDSKFNIAIRKLYKYYLTKDGFDVDMIDLKLTAFPSKTFKEVDASGYDKVYCSNLFEINQHRFKIINCVDVVIGGIGSINPGLMLDPEVEKLQPYYFDDEDTSHGFITRGCIRNCWFCKVPKFEGKLKKYNDLDDIIQHHKVKFYDNNIFAYEKCEEVFEELIKRNVRVDFNQGLDFRLATERKMELLSRLNYMGEYIFAFDDIKYEKMLNAKLTMMKKYIEKDWKMKFYVYYNAEFMSLEDMIYRVEWCRKNRVLPYIMRDKNCWDSEDDHFIKDYAAYCNQPSFFKNISFEDFMYKRSNNEYRIIESLVKYKKHSKKAYEKFNE